MASVQWNKRVLEKLLASKCDHIIEGEQALLFSADADSVQTYVFDTNRLPIIRGGSSLLTWLNSETFLVEHVLTPVGKQFNYELNERNLVFCGGGSILALFPPDENLGRALSHRLKEIYTQQSVTATISTACRLCSIAEIQRGLPSTTLPSHHMYEAYTTQYPSRSGFGQLYTLLGSLLRAEKQQRQQVPFIEVMPFVSICHECQSRPVETFISYEGEPGVPVCNVCKMRYAEGSGEQRYFWIDQLSSALQAVGYPGADKLKTFRYPNDINELIGKAKGEERNRSANTTGTASNHDQYVALVYGDGDGIGARLKQCACFDDFMTLSDKIRRITRESVAHAISSHPALHPRTTDAVLPWEVITIGGDDVLILIPARAALDFAVSLVEHFRIAGQADGLTLSAGIAIGQPSTPIRILLDVARQALKNAKRRRQETPLPAIDFHHLVKEGYFANSLPKFRDDNEALYQGRTVSAYLTGRPYTITEAQLLLSSLKAVQNGDFPNSQLHAIVRELRRSELRGSVFYSYQLARMDEAEARVMQDIKQAWSAVTDVEEYPWLTLPARSEKSHIFADLVNLL